MYSLEFRDFGLLDTVQFMLDETHWPSMPDNDRKTFFNLCQYLKDALPEFHWYDLIEHHQKGNYLRNIKEKVARFEKAATDALQYNMYRSMIFHSSSDDEIKVPDCKPNASHAQKKKTLTAMIKNDCLTATKRLENMIQI